MKSQKFKKVSWESFEKDCFKLAKQLNHLEIDMIVAISRGGLVASRILSDLLSVPISHITISSYHDLTEKKDTIIKEFPTRSFENETVLIVDEISDTGKTFKRAVSYFGNFHLKKIYILAPYLKPKSRFIPDFWSVKTPDWIIFPYELKETVDAFKKMYESAANKKLLEVGFTRQEIGNLI